MTRNLIYLFVLLNFLNINAQKENVFEHKFTYLLTYQPNNKNIYSKRTEEMVLLTNKNFSVFLSKNTFIKDSIKLASKKNNIKVDRSKYSKTSFFL